MKYIVILSMLMMAVWAQAMDMGKAGDKVKAKGMSDNGYQKPADEVLKKRLTRLQFLVTQKDDTETPFENEYWDEKRDGIYVDVVSGEVLFSSKDKYKSGTGWPSFTKPLEEKNIVLRGDRTLFFSRVEVRSKNADSHLGHVFKDGPKPTGLRYCMNSASMRFVAKENMKESGYEKYLALFESK
jgi:methionine-R-sulfoxide reductase